jgi:tetratricopeptide (TPR) repeat protein
VQRAHEMFTRLNHTLGLAQCEAVAGEIEYLLGHYESARKYIEAGAQSFEALDVPLGRGECLLRLSWVEHSEGMTERARRLALDARVEFERAGYRLGTAQANASLAHLEHRLWNYRLAETGAEDARSAFEALRTPRGQAACERLLSMIGLDTDDLAMAERHAERALDIYGQIGDPWGELESRLLRCQILLARHQAKDARSELARCSKIAVEEAEPRQHYLLTRAWLSHASGDEATALESIESASVVFGEHIRVGDHTPHLLARLSRLSWSEKVRDRIALWQSLLNDKDRQIQV